MISTFIWILLVLLVAGLVIGLINSLLPIEPRYKQAISAVIGIIVLIWILSAFLGAGPAFPAHPALYR